ERQIELVEKLEGCIQLHQRGFQRRSREPRSVEGARPKHVAAGPGEAVPIANSSAQVVLHALAEDLTVLVVILVRKRPCFCSAVLYGLNAFEERLTHLATPNAVETLPLCRYFTAHVAHPQPQERSFARETIPL